MFWEVLLHLNFCDTPEPISVNMIRILVSGGKFKYTSLQLGHMYILTADQGVTNSLQMPQTMQVFW